MDIITPSQQERTAAERVLQSGIFDKAPRLGVFFRYICERHFEGSADQIKEASIALEALGRTSDFDPKKDSIVRVEAHRLRKRLQEYYAGPGAEDPLRIIIPSGQYRPQFLSKESEQSADGHPPVLGLSNVAPEHLSPTQKVPFAQWGVWILVLSIAAGIALLLGPNWERQRSSATPKNDGADTSGGVYSPVPAEFRLLAGYRGPSFVDSQGHSWNPDAYYTGGSAAAIPSNRFIEGQPAPYLLKTQRSGRFRYDIPLSPGVYELRLYFAEIEFGRGNPLSGAEGSRTFQVTVNGAVLLPGLDVLAEAGAPNQLHITILKDIHPAPDGKLHLQFDPITGPAILDGIEILQSAPGRIHPVRIVTQPTPVTDSDGRWWAGDEYFYGGTQVSHRQNIISSPEKALYQGERYGNFSYRIPLAPGKYRLTLHFAETWFGTSESHYADVNTRRFDVYANGVALLRNFQIAKEAGGANRSIAKTFDNIEPNAQGTLLLEFVPVDNYAELNAIEVVEER